MGAPARQRSFSWPLAFSTSGGTGGLWQVLAQKTHRISAEIKRAVFKRKNASSAGDYYFPFTFSIAAFTWSEMTVAFSLIVAALAEAPKKSSPSMAVWISAKEGASASR